MKTTPTIQGRDIPDTEITRATAAYHLRRERAEGSVVKLPSGYLLTTQDRFLVSPRPERQVPVPPPQVHSLSRRLTHKYVTGWDSLDRWHPLGSCQVIASKEKPRDEYGESFRRLLIIEVDAEAAKFRPRNIARAISDAFAFGCRCEHDCCGHVQAYVSRVRHLCGNRYAAVQSLYLNV